ncbi:MAG: glycosyltransferase, partial [Chlorobiales bacterium]|nr:glycosyltransferase [Chlorobiales bacterium]
MDISVVIPLYNKRDCITRAIRSIERQTWQPKEIVVVDDGSTDDSAAIVASLGIEKLRLVRKKNGGVSSARN